MAYVIWDRINQEESQITEQEVQEILYHAPCDAGHYGYMGRSIDKVIYKEDEEETPLIIAVRYNNEWLDIPKHQAPFMEHELSTNSYAEE